MIYFWNEVVASCPDFNSFESGHDFYLCKQRNSMGERMKRILRIGADCFKIIRKIRFIRFAILS
jgi:hypothetical protein